MKARRLLKDFMDSEKSGGLVLIACTLVSLVLANSPFAGYYFSIWDFSIAGHTFVHWINDGLMAIFFLLVGLELEKEIYEGALSNFRKAMLPIAGAIGGMLVPAVIYLSLNYGLPSQSGAGIPMATDIAFALGILSLLGKRVPFALKIFLTALAVIDDLGAIIVIAIFYTTSLSFLNLVIALGIFGLLMILNKKFKVRSMIPYVLGGIAMWYFMLHSGIHATIAGVLLAFTIPYKRGMTNSPSHRMQHKLHRPVAFIVLPLFALGNTAIAIGGGSWIDSLSEPFALGIILGLIIGKPLGIVGICFIFVKLKLAVMPKFFKWKQLIGASMLAGIGFTMSIFITLLAFKEEEQYINDAKLMVLLASFVAAVLGCLWLHYNLKQTRVHSE